jgi:endonuclease/exonuclease/phosphatase family metal-dependent hydrolase
VPTTLRLLSLDARGFGGDRSALAQAIAAAAVDVACVHGGPHLLRWRSIAAAIGRKSGLVTVTGGRTAGANLVLSTLGVDVRAVRDVRFDGSSRLNPSGAALAALQLRGVDFAVVATTLAGNAAERLAQVRVVQQALHGLVPDMPPRLISAEGVDRPGTAAWQALVENGVGVSRRLFVDARVGVADAVELPGTPGVVVELTL